MWRRDSLRSRLLRALIPEKIPGFAAGLYDRIARTAVETYYSKVADDVSTHITQGLILDVGTGPGYLPIEIVRRAPKISVVGIDSSAALVRIAQRNASEAGVSDRVRYVESDANRLCLEDESCDLVISTGSLHAWKRPVLVIDECFRVLKEGREVWILDPADVITPEAVRFLNKGLKGKDRLARWWGSFTSKLTPPYNRVEMEELIRQTAFRTGTVTEGKWLTVKLRK